jgi:hypothetical protein
MRKLKLDVDSIRVDSFEASPESGLRTGTVRANDATLAFGCTDADPCTGQDSCAGGESCAVTACLTCLCPHTGPQPSCQPCSWDNWSCDPYGCD